MASSLQTGVPSAPLQPGGSSLAGGIEQAGGISLPPTLYPPPGSTSFNVADEIGIAGAGSITELPNCRVQLPPTEVGVISSLELLLDAILITSRVFWRILANGNPLPGWGAITILGRNGAASVARSWSGPLGIQIPAGALIQVTVLDSDGGAYTAGASLSGWFWPAQR